MELKATTKRHKENIDNKKVVETDKEVRTLKEKMHQFVTPEGKKGRLS